MDAFDTIGDASLIQSSSGQETFTSPATVSQVVQDNTLHEVSPLHDDEVEEFALAQDSTLQTVPVESIPSPVPSTAIHHRPSHQYRIFLDICCGLHAPLSAAVRQLSGDILQFDILIHSMDALLDNQCYESLLRVCASGIVAYAEASPSCCEYSRLKLRPSGPPALRTPEFLHGRPDLTSAQLLRVQESSIMLERCIICIRLGTSSRGHSHLEQPASAMSWDELCPPPAGDL